MVAPRTHFHPTNPIPNGGSRPGVFHPVNPMPNGGNGGVIFHPVNPLPNGRRFASKVVKTAAEDGRITVKEARTISKRYRITGTTNALENLRISSDLGRMITGSAGLRISPSAMAVLISAHGRPILF